MERGARHPAVLDRPVLLDASEARDEVRYRRRPLRPRPTTAARSTSHAASGGALPSDALAALERWDEVPRVRRAPPTGPAAVDVADDARVRRCPHPRQVFAIALNYRPHAAEAGFVAARRAAGVHEVPVLHHRPGRRPCALPEGNVDWEIEVVAVIGRGGHRIARADAWDAVAGLTCGQDLSERVLQLRGTPPQFSLGKSYPGFGPTGPVAVTPDEFADRDDVGFESRSGRRGRCSAAAPRT